MCHFYHFSSNINIVFKAGWRTSHGAYKFTAEPTGDVLRIDRIKEIHARIPDTHLVMHGSSSVPQDWLEIINNHGG
jgi:fructose-bisphosphate aldolase class II